MDLIGKKAIIFGGKTGLLGQALTKALKEAGVETTPLSSQDADVLDMTSVQAIMHEIKPDFVFNAVAYTQVDLAEEEEAAAFSLNSTAPVLLAQHAMSVGAKFIHYSTDFVFKGDKNTPYETSDQPNAFSIYGISKASGEQGLRELDYPETLIIRISWLFGPGRINFVQKILQLASERESLNVVNDQTGSPSYTVDIANNTLKLLRANARGIQHLSNSGSASWYDLANRAVELAGINCDVRPVPTSAYPTKAMRPAYSVLDLSEFTKATGETPRHWSQALRQYVCEDLGYGS